MSAFDEYTWYVLTNALQSENKTLTAANNTQSAFNANSPSPIFFSALTDVVPPSQQWQIFPVNTSSASAYIMRNRQIGPSAYLTTAITTRKCGGGTCATVPVLAPTVNNESLWYFGDWGFSDALGGASIYNLGNTSNWRLDTLLTGPDTEMVNTTDTGYGGQHYYFSAHEKFGASDSSAYATVPSTVTALLAQFTNSGVPAVTSIQTDGISSGTSSGNGASNTGSAGSGTSSSSSSSSGLSSGAAAGIGVGVGIAVIAIFVIAFLLFRRRRSRARPGTKSNPAEMSHYEGAAKQHNSPSQTSPGSDSSMYASKGPMLRAEMQSTSGSERVELYSPPAQEVPRYEMPPPSNSPRIEMEHPSTRNSTLISSTEGLAGSDNKR